MSFWKMIAIFTQNGNLLLAGGEGFEPSTPNLGGWCSIRTELLAQFFSEIGA